MTNQTEALAFDAEFVLRALVASGGVRDAVFQALARLKTAALSSQGAGIAALAKQQATTEAQQEWKVGNTVTIRPTRMEVFTAPSAPQAAVAQVREQAALPAEAVQFGRRMTVKPDYSDMSKEALERHAERMAQLLADNRPIEFHRRHAMGSKAMPSCLCCGKLPEEVAIKHMELPNIVICKTCRNAALAQGTTPAAGVGEAVGAFSIGADGGMCFHRDEFDLEQLIDRLNSALTGGPYRAVVAYAAAAKPAQAEPMSDAEIDEIACEHSVYDGDLGAVLCDMVDIRNFARAILAEAGIKEKTNG